MKKSILFLIGLFLAFASISNAQTEKGKILLGTTVNLTGNLVNFLSPQSNNVGVSFGTATSKYGSAEDKTKITLFNFSPQVGYFFADGFAGGILVNYMNYTEKEEDSDEKFTNSVFKAGPYLRYYFDSPKFNPYLHAGASFGSIDFDGGDDKTKIMELGGGVGLAIFLNDFVSFDILAGYNYLKLIDESSGFQGDLENTLSNFALDIGFTVLLGGSGEE